jgi:hypothetical protein
MMKKAMKMMKKANEKAARATPSGSGVAWLSSGPT